MSAVERVQTAPGEPEGVANGPEGTSDGSTRLPEGSGQDDTLIRLPGVMETAVERDLARLPKLDVGVRGSLSAIARRLAQAMDETGDDRPTPAQMGALAQQLRTTLTALAEVEGDTDATAAFFKLMRTAVFDSADPLAADQGATGRPNRRTPRKAASPVATPRGQRRA